MRVVRNFFVSVSLHIRDCRFHYILVTLSESLKKHDIIEMLFVRFDANCEIIYQNESKL